MTPPLEDPEVGSAKEFSDGADTAIDTGETNTMTEVTWDSDDDPANPLNWSAWKKTLNVGIVGTLAFITPLESSTIVPALPLLAQDYHETRKSVMSLYVSILVIGLAFGPLLLSPLSELYGRRIVYNVTNVVHLGFTIGCALAPNTVSFIILRFLVGCVGSGPMNICGGTVADQVPLSRRGAIMSIMFTGIFLAPVIGPIIGGFIAQGAGWRWVFWLITILQGVMTIFTFIFLTESHGPTLLRRKARRLNKERPGSYEAPTVNARTVLLRAITRPMRMLLFSPIVAGLSFYLALVYGYMYLVFTTFSTVFPDQYGFDTAILGLAFLGFGVGMILALAILSWLSDWAQRTLTEKHGVSKPEYRLLPLVLGVPLLPIALFVYGWTCQYKVHWIVPIIFTGFMGFGLIFSYVPTQIYMVDAFTKYAASALAATSVVRSLFGGCLPIAGLPMYSALGYGWGNSLLGFIAIAASVAPLIFWRYGERLRVNYVVSFD